MGSSQLAAPPGIELEVVVWLPLTQTQRIVSPTFTLGRFEGLKLKFWTFTIHFVA